MRSRADGYGALAWRVALEWLLRATTVALLALLLWRASHPGRAATTSTSARSATLGRALVAWTRQPPSRAVVTLDSVPSPAQRDWLAALRHTGVTLLWDGQLWPPTALTVTGLPDPAGAWEIDAASASGARLLLHDALGALDSISRVSGPTVRVMVPRIVQGVIAHDGGTRDGGTRDGGARASASPRDSLVLRRLLVEGAASWETRFTVAALQERGWSVDALIHVAPSVDVRVGTPTAPDTTRYAAAIAVDSSAHLVAGAATNFVRSGGGLITLHDAATIGPAGTGAVVLERRADGEVRAARFGAGRVIRVGYPDLWRERMAGGDSTTASVRDPVARHRDWLARIVSSAAYAPRIPVHSAWADDPAPFADFVDRAGPGTYLPMLAEASSVAHPRGAFMDTLSGGLSNALSDTLIALLLVLSLLGEWLSRRLRGAR